MFLEISYSLLLRHFHDMGETIGLSDCIFENSYLREVIPFPTHIEVFKCILRDIHQSTIIMIVSQRIFFRLEVEFAQMLVSTLL